MEFFLFSCRQLARSENSNQSKRKISFLFIRFSIQFNSIQFIRFFSSGKSSLGKSFHSLSLPRALTCNAENPSGFSCPCSCPCCVMRKILMPSLGKSYDQHAHASDGKSYATSHGKSPCSHTENPLSYHNHIRRNKSLYSYNHMPIYI